MAKVKTLQGVITQDVPAHIKEGETGLYVAYGMNTTPRNMFRETKGEGVIVKGIRLAFRGCADIVQDETAECGMILWEIDSRTERSLDAREGVSKGFYSRRVILLSDGRKALIYQMKTDRMLAHCGELREYGYQSDYVSTIKEGLKIHKVPVAHVIVALARAKAQMVARGD